MDACGTGACNAMHACISIACTHIYARTFATILASAGVDARGCLRMVKPVGAALPSYEED